MKDWRRGWCFKHLVTRMNCSVKSRSQKSISNKSSACKSRKTLKSERPSLRKANISDVVSDEDALARELILWRLKSLETQIQVHQFFPRLYLLQKFPADDLSSKQNESTYTTLQAFIKNYLFTSEQPPWGERTLLEVENFQAFDAPSIRNYLRTHWTDEASREDFSEKTSEEMVPSSGSRTVSPCSNTSKEIIHVVKRPSESKSYGKWTESSNGDQTSVNSGKSSKTKSKIKAVFTFGSKKKSGVNGHVAERTKDLLAKHVGGTRMI